MSPDGHGTWKEFQKKLMNDKKLLETTEMYFFDFVVFGYAFPKIPTRFSVFTVMSSLHVLYVHYERLQLLT
jgi:hypothetical protein